MIDLQARLSQASLPEDTVPVCLVGDLNVALRKAQQGDDIEALHAAIDAAREHTDQWRLRGLARPAWTTLLAAHPPRDGQPQDQAYGWNDDTLTPALVRACLIDPDVTDDAQWAALLDVLTPAQLQDLVNVAFGLTRLKADLTPFSSPA